MGNMAGGVWTNRVVKDKEHGSALTAPWDREHAQVDVFSEPLRTTHPQQEVDNANPVLSSIYHAL